HIHEYCTSTFCPACGSRMEKFRKIDNPPLKNPKHKDHIAMAAAASDSITASTTSAAVSVAAVTTAVFVATKTAANAASITESVQQSRNQ
ncbi:hypothetical protein BX661DRAFT_176970, partial [Kickxella alabastrina]|uniref:uncharacterized protein n=1 Tax=Kickxella alabastrina TaxID=61397 RepID=UPI00221F7AA1